MSRVEFYQNTKCATTSFVILFHYNLSIRYLQLSDLIYHQCFGSKSSDHYLHRPIIPNTSKNDAFSDCITNESITKFFFHNKYLCEYSILMKRISHLIRFCFSISLSLFLFCEKSSRLNMFYSYGSGFYLLTSLLLTVHGERDLFQKKCR